MDAALAGLIGASIGAITGLLGGLSAGWQQRKADLAHWQQSRSDDVWKEERRSLLELTALLAEGSQAVAWLAWAATGKPMDAVKAEAAEYDVRMRALLPKLFSAQAAASGLSDSAFMQVDPLVQRLTTLDTQLGNSYIRLDTDSENAMQELRQFTGPAHQLSRDIVLSVRSLLRLERQQFVGPTHPDVE